jgi:CHAT domain-containing protein
VLVEQNNPQDAIVELQAAARIIESVRDRLREERFRAGYVQDKNKVYIDLVRLQLELGLTREAFSTAERLRARSFLYQLENGGPVARNGQERQDEVALRERVRQLQKALEDEHGMAPSDRRQLAVDTFSSELLAAERDYQAFLDDLKGRSIIGQVNRIPVLTEIQAQLMPAEALVEYVVGDAQVTMFLMRREKLSAVVKELRYGDLFAKVNLVRELVQRPANDGWWAPAASLADALIGPLQQAGLLQGVNHLYVVPHGILNYLPFALLPVRSSADDHVVMEQYTLTYLPAAGMLRHLSKDNSTSKSLLALAPANARLRYALEEAQMITNIYQPESRLLSGSNATESAFKKMARDYQVLHLSTHAYFNVNNPLLSGLKLEADDSNDGFLEVHEILDLSLNAALVTLSACETGMGSGYFNQIPSGDEFIGLTRSFLLAGSRSVLATLWPVDDRSTVKLMEGFYQRLVREGGAHDQALALAQIQRDLRKTEKYRHPFYWAPFVLVGKQDQRANAFELVKRG